jgi:3-deoxy-D-manno-octulosonic acid kinase
MSRPTDTTPAGFERFESGGVQLVAASNVAASLAAVLQTAPTLYDWAAEQPQSLALRGRAPVYVATLPTGDTVAIRHAWHGGALAPITRDLWLRPSRAPQELRKSIALVNGGVPTAPVLGYALYPVAPGIVRVDVISRFVENTFDLGAVLLGLAGGIRMDEAATATRVLLAALQRQQLVHPDLNVKNILVQKGRREAGRREAGGRATDNASVRALVIDVDVMQHRRDLSPGDVAVANIRRLTRSLHKWRRQTDATFDVAAILGEIIMTAPAEQAPLPPIVGFDDR